MYSAAKGLDLMNASADADQQLREGGNPRTP